MSRYIVTTGLNFRYTFDLFYIYFTLVYITVLHFAISEEDIECRLKIFFMKKEEKEEW